MHTQRHLHNDTQSRKHTHMRALLYSICIICTAGMARLTGVLQGISRLEVAVLHLRIIHNNNFDIWIHLEYVYIRHVHFKIQTCIHVSTYVNIFMYLCICVYIIV